MIKRFFKDLKQYFGYVIMSARSELKSEVAGSFLSWLWWILDPLLYMLVYAFIAILVFRSSEPYFPVFVFIGLSCWQFFSKSVTAAVKLIHSNRQIVTKIYLPKHMLVLEKMAVYGFKMLVSFALTAVFMVIYRVPLSWNIFSVIPLLVLLFLVTFGICLIIMHFGVFVEDLQNIITVALRLGMYLSGIFYSIENRLSSISALLANLVLKVNPLALIMTDMRHAMMCTGNIHWISVAAWFLIAAVICLFGIKLIYKHENSYTKVI